MTQVQQVPQEGVERGSSLPRPNRREAWPKYWQSQGQPWRRETEIDETRQQELTQRRIVAADPQSGIYPFKEMRLSRADIEWLLATHEQGKGPVDWQDATQQRREGLDVRGAHLTSTDGTSPDLRGLPLSRLRGGLARSQWNGWAKASKELLQASAVDMENVDLFGAHLEGADLIAANLKKADLRLVGLVGANLTGAQLTEANLTGAQLTEANLTGAQLERVYLTGAQLAKANLHGAHLKNAILFGAQLKDASLTGANLEGAHLVGVQLEGGDLRRARLGRATLSGSMEGVDLSEAILADEHGIGPCLAAVQWGDTNLSGVDWSSIKQLGDEQSASQATNEQGQQKDSQAQLDAFKQAVKAYRQLALALHAQGLYEEAAYFSYRAHRLQREVLRRQAALPEQARTTRLASVIRYLGSLLLDLTTGYGYKPWRSIITYLLVIMTFALVYVVFDHAPLMPTALASSMMAFHGSGFLANANSANPITLVMAIEAAVGLLVEVSYIVVFVRRSMGH